MKHELWILPADTEFCGKDGNGGLLAITASGVEEAIDLTGMVSDIRFEIEAGGDDDRHD